MRISELVKGETIKIDNHHAGQPISIEDDGLHLHKRYNHHSKYDGKVDVRIPLNMGEIQVDVAKGRDSGIILREIRKAFSKEEIRNKFIRDIKKELTTLAEAGYRDQHGKMVLDEDGRKKVNEAIVNVAKLFGMSKDDVTEHLYETADTVTMQFKSPRNREIGNRNFPEVLYVRANVSDDSFLVTSSRYMLKEAYD